MGRTGVLLLPWIVAALALALVIAWLASKDPLHRPAHATLSVRAAMSVEESAGYLRADGPHEFSFPADHAAHDGFKTEWWYFTGNLETTAGRRFGYQLTFFRSALTPRRVERASTFAAEHVWMAHFALSDIEGQHFHSFERFARESGGIAGATMLPVSVWLRDWRCDFSAAGLPLRVVAVQDGISIDLSLDSKKAPVLQGENGLSRKNARAGNASYYYSLTRLETSGWIRLGGSKFDVRGTSWMDREWMTSELESEQIGWEWFALQLDDGSELTWYRLRRKDGSDDPFNAGSFVDKVGSRMPLRAKDVDIVEDKSWTSPRTKAVYPAHWLLRIQSLGVDLEVTPALADQELDSSFKYWEGAVDVSGTRAGRKLQGRGYVELVGYAKLNSSDALGAMR